MSATSPSSYSLSIMLHGAFVAAILFTAYAFKDETNRKSTEIFELVAGAGDNWAATEAPAESSSSGVKFQAPPKPLVQPAPQPVTPAPEPEPIVRPAPVEASPVTPVAAEPVVPPKVEPKKTTPPQKSFAEQIKQTAKQKERAIMTKHRREVAAREKKEAAERAKREAAEAAQKKATMTKEEFDRLNGRKVAANTKAAPADYQKVSTSGITGGTSDQAGAGGTVLSRAEQDQLATYFAMLKQRLLAAHEKPLGVSDQLSARVSFYIAASGALSQARIIKSSGNAEFDQSVLATFRTVGSIGKRPDNRSDTREVTFDLRDVQ